MAQERYFSRVKQDIFRPFTGRHRGIAFEVTVDLYDRLLGSAADYDLVLNRQRLIDIVGTTIAQNRDLIVGSNDMAQAENSNEDAELDQSYDDGEYARRLVSRLAKYGILESHTDATHLTACGTQARGGGGGGHGGGMGGFGGGHMGGFGGDHIGGFEGGRIGGLGGDHVGGLGGNHIAPLDHGHLGAGRRHFGGYYGYGFEYPYDPYDQSYNWQYTCSY